ncbi:MAG: response regulator transcription factor [Ardenticatenaceae bacterium]|nr:response regulator transcription factor [Ardenticatenaceae bacterium]HBY93886.1 DNA-binding response regulator [Chloroflexota bacterium]
MTPIRVLLVDDHTLFRAGIRVLLQDQVDIEVVAETGDPLAALQLIETHRPDVVLMDISMPGLSGLEATVQVVHAFPHVRVIILSMYPDEEYVSHALHAGAAGYLLKEAAVAELGIAVRAAARGETYLSPQVSTQVVIEYKQRARSIKRLTPRQREILRLIAKGYSSTQIAEALFLSVKTVESHRTELMKRLAIHDIAGLVRYAIRVGLVTPDE